MQGLCMPIAVLPELPAGGSAVADARVG